METTNEPSTPEQKITLGLIISWILGSLFGIAGISYLFSEPLTGIVFTLIALVLLPPVGEFIKKKYNYSLSGVLKAVIVIILLAISSSTLTSSYGDSAGTLLDSDKASSEGTAQESSASIEIVDIYTKITEQNSVWWKYAWNLTLKNNTSRDRSVTATIKWVDSDGFVVESATAYSLAIPAGEEKIFNEFELIDASVAGDVAGIEAEI